MLARNLVTFQVEFHFGEEEKVAGSLVQWIRWVGNDDCVHTTVQVVCSMLLTCLASSGLLHCEGCCLVSGLYPSDTGFCQLKFEVKLAPGHMQVVPKMCVTGPDVDCATQPRILTHELHVRYRDTLHSCTAGIVSVLFDLSSYIYSYIIAFRIKTLFIHFGCRLMVIRNFLKMRTWHQSCWLAAESVCVWHKTGLSVHRRALQCLYVLSVFVWVSFGSRYMGQMTEELETSHRCECGWSCVGLLVLSCPEFPSL